MFEFTIPEEHAPQSPRSLAVSIVVHSLAVLLLFAIRFSGVAKFPAAPEHFTLIAPIAPVKPAPLAPPKLRAPRVREFHPQPPVAHLTLPAVPVIAAPAIELPKPAVPEIPHAAPPVAAIKASGFTEVKPAAPLPVAKPVVRNAGFESSEAVTNTARNPAAAVGSFESASQAAGEPVRKSIARSGGFSEASTEPSSVIRRASIASAAFGDTTVDRSAPARQVTAAARVTPVEIISKPKPAYTAEARAKNIEGEVLLDVQFNASGEVRILRVARGLGSGLDETAIAAARAIRFRPATRDGAEVDSTALLHIVFQLAN